jgi:hypothetical protein
LPRWERIATDPSAPGSDSDTEWYDIAAAPDGTLVAVGSRYVDAVSTAAAWWSHDGITWAEIVLPGSPGSVDYRDTWAGGIAHGRTGFVVIGGATDDHANDLARIWTSPTGETWAVATEPPVGAGASLNEIAATSWGYLVVGGRSANGKGKALAWSSSDGDIWSREVIDDRGSEVVATSLVVRPDGSVLAAGDSTRPIRDESKRHRPRFWTRDDRGWTRLETLIDHESRAVAGIGRTGDGYILSSYDPWKGGRTTYVSPDAVAWQPIRTFDDSCSWAFSPLERGILAFCDGAVLTSPDGIAWTSTPEPAFLQSELSAVVVRSDGSLMAFGSLAEDAPEHRLVTWIGSYD